MLWLRGTKVRLLLRVLAWRGCGRWRVVNPLSDDLDPSLRLVDVEHVLGTGQRDQSCLGQQTHNAAAVIRTCAI